MAVRVQLHEITNDEGNRLLRIVRRTSGLTGPHPSGTEHHHSGHRLGTYPAHRWR